MASKGYAVTFGLGKVNDAAHGQRSTPLPGCPNDAREMAAYL